MRSYEAKSYYQDTVTARRYDSQFEGPLSLWNLRAKIIGWRERIAFSKLLNHAPPDGTVLDIACGTGIYTELLLSRGHNAGGVDISEQMLDLGKVRVGDHPKLLFWQRGDAESLPFDDQEFDGITCMRFFHRVPPDTRETVLQEIRRVGRGWAILSFGMSTPWLDVRRKVRSALLRGQRPSNPFPVSPAALRHQLTALGFTVHRSRWVLPGLSDGMLVFLTWQ